MDSAQMTLDKELLLRNVCYKISLLAGNSRSSTSILDGGLVDETYHSTQQQQRREPSSRDTDHMMLPDGPIHNVDNQVDMSSSMDDEIPIHDQIGAIIPEQLPPRENKRSRLKRFGDDTRKYQLPSSSNTPEPIPLGEENASLFHGSNNTESAQSIPDRDESTTTNHTSVPKGLVAAAPPPFDKDKLRMKSIRDHHRRIVKGSNHQPTIESIPSAAQQHGLLPSIEQPKDGHRRKQQTALKQLSKDDSKSELKSELRLPPLVPPRPRVSSTPPQVPNDSMGKGGDNQEQSLSAKKRRPKKPLFMRMIDEAQRRYEEDEKLKHEEYNKFKEHKAKRPTREEIKAHIALHDQQRELVKQQRNEEMRKKMPVRPKGFRKSNGNNDASPDSISMGGDDSIIDTRVTRPPLPRDGSLESLSALSSPRESKNSKLHPKKGDRRVRLGAAAAAEVTAAVSGRENSQLPSSSPSNDSSSGGGGGAKPFGKSTILPAVIQPPSLASYVSSDWLVQCLHGDDWVTGDHRWPQAPPPIDALKIM